MTNSANTWIILLAIFITISGNMAEENQQKYDPIIGFADDYFFWKEGLRFRVIEGVSFGFGGRFVYDTFSMDIDRNLVDEDLENFNTPRAVRFNATGTFKDIFRFKAEIDFADTDGLDFEFKSNYLFFRDPIYKMFQLQIGYAREPFGLEELTSARFTTFMERALNTFNPGRNLGFTLSAHYQKRILFAIGLFNDQSGDNPPTFSSDSEALTTRLCGLVYKNSEAEYWHLGIAYSFRKPRDNNAEFDTRPDGKFGLDVITTGIIEDVDTVQLFGLESAFIQHNFSIQAEFVSAYVKHNENDHFWGAYIYCSYFFTGESRRYKPLSGKFTEIIPLNPMGKSWDSFGAIELTARYSHINLDSGEFNETMNNVTLGLNWYLTTYARITTNYIFSYVNTQDANHILGIRFQVYW